MDDYIGNPQSQHSICHLTSKWLRTFATLGVIFTGYRPPSVDDYPRNPLSRTFHRPPYCEAAWFFRCFRGHFGWISTTHNERVPQTNPQSHTFHLPFHFKMASYFCCFRGHFGWISATLNGRLPRKLKIANMPSSSLLLNGSFLLPLLGSFFTGYPPPSMGENPRKPTMANIPPAILI